MSTISMIKRGKPKSGLTKHVNIRYYWLRDREEKGEVNIVHIGTDEMIADIFTKPLQGERFNYLRGLLLNGNISQD
jgi:hypothetical protein